ncbi:MAG: T9SS type A sorting domain-containing protein [Saprospiraceae bacterium]|jgi:uncharacterized repeat protein (TIGR01451 family)|nr:T9SS type A sorting domain-containing protein [Saprospiraceae bacterium]
MKMCLAVVVALATLQMGWSQQTYTVSGTITNESGFPLEGVEVSLVAQASLVELTDENGYYEFQVPEGTNASVVPMYDGVAFGPITTYDVVLIKKHINDVELLDSPYKIIAADIDNSGEVNPTDTTLLWQYILGIISEFPNNNRWRFVDASFMFPDPANPFLTPFPETIELNDINGDISDLNFIAIRVGDVNTNAIIEPVYSSKIKGKVYFDQDETCTQTAGDGPLQSWNVVATGANGSFYGNTQANGEYKIFLPPGTYDVQVVQQNGLWMPCTATVSGVTIAQHQVAIVDFAQQAINDCPAMNVEMSTWLLLRCFDSEYYVTYCNNGTVSATDASVEVTLDAFFEDVSASIPWASVAGNTYTFELGDVAVGECGEFTINFTVSCDAELDQTHCSSAHIYPDETCVPPNALWSGANLVVNGECVGDEVVFTITNQGDDMTEPVEYVVIEDIMIQMTADDLLLNGGETRTVSVPANGATWRLEAKEAAYHPYETFASATVEGCPDGAGPTNLGIVNLFPMPDESPFEDIDCQENLGSFDPNDKTGYPLGVGDQRFIKPGQPLDYRIRFQNTGTYTAFTVVIIDSLPETLDPASITMLGSSHPYTFQLDGRGVAKFIFNDIMLPDSNANEPLSHGFVKFSIAQKPGLALGTTIENEAAIYFDFNEPVITNRTLHTLGEDFLMEVSASQTLVKGVEMDVFPNPFEAVANFRFNGMELSAGLLTVFDQQGRPLSTTPFTGATCRFDGTGLSSGIYFFKVENAGVGVATGRIVVK